VNVFWYWVTWLILDKGSLNALLAKVGLRNIDIKEG